MSRRILIAALAVAMAFPALAAAQAPRVDNGAKPAEGRVEVALKEVWRAGGEDDEIFFGSIGSVQRSKDGKIYVLDTQQSQVQVYSDDGSHLATLGREGDGPGEVRRPSGMLQLTDGRLCLLQGYPGRIVMLRPDGTPAGEATYQSGEVQQGQFTVLNAGFGAPNGEMVLLGIKMSFGGQSSLSDQTFFLSRCDATGREKVNYLTKGYQIDYADFRLDEGKMDFVWSRFAVGSDGRIYTAPERNAYLVRVQSPDGKIEREITRPHSARPRDAGQREIATSILEAVGGYYPTPLKGTTIEDSEPAITSLFLDDAGNLLVNAGDTRDLPPGVFALLDVFDKQGKYVRQLALRCPGDPRKDGLAVLSGGRVVILRGALDAWLSQQAVGKEGAAEAETPTLEVVCYSMSS